MTGYDVGLRNGWRGTRDRAGISLSRPGWASPTGRIDEASFAPNAYLFAGLSTHEKAAGDTDGRDVVIDDHVGSTGLRQPPFTGIASRLTEAGPPPLPGERTRWPESLRGALLGLDLDPGLSARRS